MSEKINIENYEAFYLDYLEGNLNFEDAQDLLIFLDKNPHLIVENFEEISLFDKPLTKLSKTDLNALKVFDETAAINHETIEGFLIARIEKQLNENKISELNQFLTNNPKYYLELELYKKTILPIENIPFLDKNDLKKPIVISIYTKYLAIAASISIIVASYFFIPKNETISISENKLSRKTLKQKQTITNTKSIESKNQVNSHKANFHIAQTKTESKNEKVLEIKVQNNIERNASLNLSPKKLNFSPIESSEIVVISTKEHEKNDQNLGLDKIDIPKTFLPIEEMQTPILLLTKTIKKKFNHDFILRLAKATKEKQGGFYLKIGNFEIARKKKPNNEELASY